MARYMIPASFLLLLAAQSVPPAIAQPATSSPGSAVPRQTPMLGILDLDRDGSVSAEEYMTYRGKEFVRLDANKDGAISKDEFLAQRGRPSGRGAGREAQLKAYDKNSDGTITREEWDSWSKSRFASRDKDGSGKLTTDEMGPMWRGRVGGMSGMGGMPGGRPMGRPSGG